VAFPLHLFDKYHCLKVDDDHVMTPYVPASQAYP
jgi:hypothetical protein